MPKKSHPHHIDMAKPQVNFVEACAINHGENFFDYMYGNAGVPYGSGPPAPKSSGYGHGIGQRAGKLRLSGSPGAHRIGARKK